MDLIEDGFKALKGARRTDPKEEERETPDPTPVTVRSFEKERSRRGKWKRG